MEPAFHHRPSSSVGIVLEKVIFEAWYFQYRFLPGLR